jgi:hypothetical protein
MSLTSLAQFAEVEGQILANLPQSFRYPFFPNFLVQENGKDFMIEITLMPMAKNFRKLSLQNSLEKNI